MKWGIFWMIYTFAAAFVILQAFTAWLDGFFTPDQLKERGIKGWSFVQHGGMWADVIIIAPLLGYIATRYKLDLTSFSSLGILAIDIIVILLLVKQWEAGGINVPEAHTHFGITPATGWIHAIFFAITFWMLAQVYCGLTTPVISKYDLVMISIALTPFFFFGAVKFGERWWILQGGARWLVLSEVACIWALTVLRLTRA